LEKAWVTIVVRRKEPVLPITPYSSPKRIHEYTEAHGASSTDLQAVRSFAEEYGLQPRNENAATRTIELHGRVDDLRRAFGTELETVRIDGVICRHRTGFITVPEDLLPAIEAVLGLDNRPIARPHCVKFRADHSTPRAAAHSPLEVAELYEFPSHLDGSGQTIGIIELDGGFIPSDVETYFRKLGLMPPKIETVLIDGQTNRVSRYLPLHPELNRDDEVAADIEIAGAIAPGSRLVVYFAQNTDQSFLKAVNAAIFATPRPACISISWGQAENVWSKQAMRAFEAAFQDAANLGIPVCVSAGNSGWFDPTGSPHVEFPASSPHALACGGTRLIASHSAITRETVWSAEVTCEDMSARRRTDVSQSQFFAKPLYQSRVAVLSRAEGSSGGRGVPDVSGNADPATGYRVRVKGVEEIIGGTGAVAALWAALIARMGQAMAGPVGFLHPQIYKPRTRAEGFRDIPDNSSDSREEDNSNNRDGNWNPFTGLGAPKASALLRALGAPPPPPKPEARMVVHPIKSRIHEPAHLPESPAQPAPLSLALTKKKATSREPAAETRIGRPPKASLQPPAGLPATLAARTPASLPERALSAPVLERPEILGPRTSDVPRVDWLNRPIPVPEEYGSAAKRYLPAISNHVDPVALAGILGLTALTGMTATLATVTCLALGNGRRS
jgi:kumamolisin